jgi:hypothetical protein
VTEEETDNTVAHASSRSIPHEFFCPITLELMQDPVSARDGHTYERSAIENWFAQSSQSGRTATSPKTGDLIGRQLLPNHTVRTLIEEAKTGEVQEVAVEPVVAVEPDLTVEPDLAVEPALEKLLVSLHLQQYLKTFAQQGYDELVDVRDATAKELVEDVRMKVGHAKRLAKHLAKG